ncbi:MAG TPA: hypothetical protein VME22_13130 [Solirubrobacteraceae bacterium]|nr:hypothetical protein [Solirubrobacteraceae bacterium]
MRDKPVPGEGFAGAVYFRRRAMGLRGELALLEIILEGTGRVALSNAGGQKLFSHPPSELRVARASKTAFRVQHQQERWWLSGTTFRAGKEFGWVRERIERNDLILAVPKLPETDERAYNPLMSNQTAQQLAWCRLWIEALRDAGAQIE